MEFWRGNSVKIVQAHPFSARARWRCAREAWLRVGSIFVFVLQNFSTLRLWCTWWWFVKVTLKETKKLWCFSESFIINSLRYFAYDIQLKLKSSTEVDKFKYAVLASVCEWNILVLRAYRYPAMGLLCVLQLLSAWVVNSTNQTDWQWLWNFSIFHRAYIVISSHNYDAIFM